MAAAEQLSGLRLTQFDDGLAKTISVKRTTKLMSAFILCAVMSVCVLIASSVRWSHAVSASSSPVGTQLTFMRSNATITIKGIYTDAERSALVVRFGFPTDADQLALPIRGSDYDVFIANDSLPNTVKELDVMFGRVSTDGDMLLIIPQPNDALYSVFIMNTKYLGYATDVDVETDSRAAGIQSISRALSQYTPNDTAEPYVIANDSLDVVSMRLSMEPFVDDELHTPTVVQGTIVNDGKIDYDVIVNEIFLRHGEDAIKSNIAAETRNKEHIEAQIADYSERLRLNSRDTAATAALNSARDALTESQNTLSVLNRQLAALSTLTIDDSAVIDAQTIAIHVEKPEE